MSDAVRYEWTRIRTLRSTYWLIGMGLLVSAGIALIFALVARDEPLNTEEAAGLLTGGASVAIPFIAIFMAIIGVFATGHEYRHGTVQPTLTTIPQRSTLLVAKIIIVLVVAAVVAVVALAINYAIGQIFWGEMPALSDSPINGIVPGYIVYVMLYTLCGLAFAQLFRGVPSALVVILLFPLVIEGLITGLSMIPALDWLVPVVKFLPFTAGSLLMATGAPDMGPDAPGYDFFGRWASGGVFAAFVAIILAVAWYLFKKRDA